MLELRETETMLQTAQHKLKCSMGLLLNFHQIHIKRQYLLFLINDSIRILFNLISANNKLIPRKCNIRDKRCTSNRPLVRIEQGLNRTAEMDAEMLLKIKDAATLDQVRD